MNVAVVDNRRNLKTFARVEDAGLGSIDIVIDKVFTSASFLVSTQDLTDMAQPGQPLFGLNTTNDGRVVIFAGGIPLMRDGEVVGAIGVSGGTVDQDQEVAEAGVEALQPLVTDVRFSAPPQHFTAGPIIRRRRPRAGSPEPLANPVSGPVRGSTSGRVGERVG